jgi:hypothetical protein
MTDQEFWAVMAINVEEARTMPELVSFFSWYSPWKSCDGLCAMVNSAHCYGLISDAQRDRLSRQIREVRPPTRVHFSYFWKEGAWRPRVKAMRRLADIAMKEAKCPTHQK